MNFEKIRQEVKYLFFDLDGTLINDERKLASHNAELPKLLKSLNLKYSIITGRPYFMMLKEIDELQPMLPIVAMNGALIFNNNNILYEKKMDHNLVKSLITYLETNNLNFYLYTSKKIYVSPNDFSHVNRWRNIIKMLPEKYQWEIDIVSSYNYQEPVFKFLVSSEKQDCTFNSIQKTFGDNLSLSKSTFSSIDIGTANITKGSGLLELMKILNAKPHEFMVFGDGGNDLPMFEIAKYSVAMSNAANFVKEAATFVTDNDNNNGGVIKFIKKIWNV